MNLGLYGVYLVTRPEHVRYVLENPDVYRREGWLWRPQAALIGEQAGLDPSWLVKRDAIQEMASGPAIDAFVDDMAETITRAVDELGARVEAGRPVDAESELTRIVYRAITRVFIGDLLSSAETDRLGRALSTAFTALQTRLMLPVVPSRVPLPGDRVFRRAVREIDELVYPAVYRARRRGATGTDIASRLIRARPGDPLDDQRIRDGIVALYLAGTETTVKALTFLWAVLGAHPQVASRLRTEIEQVVGRERLRGEHRRGLRYTRAVAQEVLRLYPPGWMLPRMVGLDDVIDGVRVRGGSLMVLSPYLTNRLDDQWDRAHEFVPERWLEPGSGRDRYAYLTFGGGPGMCVGRQFFLVEAQLIIAAMISRLRPVLYGLPAPQPRLGLTLKPREPIRLLMQPVRC